MSLTDDFQDKQISRGAVARKFIIFIFLSIYFIGSAQAENKVLAVQSIAIAPYEQAVKGFEHVYGSAVNRLYISGLKDKNVLKNIHEFRPNIVLAVGTDALMIARRVKTVPVVYMMVLNPLSILAGEKNISGVGMNLPPARQLHALSAMLPDAKNIGLLYNPDQTGIFVEQARDAAGKMGLNLTATAVRRSYDVPVSLGDMKGKIDVFWMLPDLKIITPETVESIVLFSLENKVPILTFSEKYLEMGAVLSVGIDPFDIGCQAGEMAKKIENGVTDSRHVDARKTSVSVNLKTAEKLGIRIDRKAVRNLNIIK